MAPGAERPITSACLVVDGEILRDRPSASPSQEGVDQAGFVRLDAAILGDFVLDSLGRVSMSLCFVCVRSTVRARGPRDILCFPGHGAAPQNGQSSKARTCGWAAHQALSDGRRSSNGLSPTATT